MSSAPPTSFNPLKIALTATGIIAAATVSYAVYFDYRRRNDAVFRKNILKEYKKVDKKVKHAQEAGKEQIQAALKRAIALANAEPVPTTAEGKEQFFMEQVALAEQLAARSPEFYVAAAISFYKALKVYPAPQELIMIYQKSLPPAVFDLVMELISLEINSSRASASASAGGPKISEEEPILQELEEGEKGENQAEKGEKEEEEEEIQINNSNKAPSSTTGSEGSPSSGSFVHVETDTNEGEAIKVQVGTTESSEESPAAPATASDDPPEEPIAA
ncbi:TOM complex receptor protein TOM20 [Sporobolomyces salmoneus]|uniref:TOM complex receptor protein TOM20 n=1 Tax=Sporobolomyces salmoneus TaxID=183962 RepID=UPI003180ABB0